MKKMVRATNTNGVVEKLRIASKLGGKFVSCLVEPGGYTHPPRMLSKRMQRKRDHERERLALRRRLARRVTLCA